MVAGIAVRAPSSLDPKVREAVLAWARADSLAEANRELANIRRTLEPPQAKELREVIAELSVDSLFSLLETQRGLSGGETFEVFGLELERVQIERFIAWARDQRETARALGVEVEAWAKMIERAVAAARGHGVQIEPSAARDVVSNVAFIERSFGGRPAKFQNRPAAGSSPRAGLGGLLAARKFKS